MGKIIFLGLIFFALTAFVQQAEKKQEQNPKEVSNLPNLQFLNK